MKVLRTINNISDELKATIPQLMPGEIRRFKMLTGVANNDPDEEERRKRPVFYGNYQIPCYDRIRDPYLNNGKGGYVDIGVVEQFETATERPTKYRTFIPGSNIAVPGLWNGEFYLSGDNIEDIELFEYLWICNYNGKNPNRDKSKSSMFEEIDFAEINQKADDELDNLEQAIEAVKSMSMEEMLLLAKKLPNFGEYDAMNLPSRMKKYATSFPNKFLEVSAKKKRGRKPKEEAVA